jgi:hypothetical protein
MRKILGLMALVLTLSPGLFFGQMQQIYESTGSGVPTGACNAQMQYFNVTNATMYFCGSTNGGTTYSWIALASGVKTCTMSLGDGKNAIPAGTYPLDFQCSNDTSIAYTILSIQCASDNSGASTCDVATNAPSDLLATPITALSSWQTGTLSSTTTITTSQYLKRTFVADGSSKQITMKVVVSTF